MTTSEWTTFEWRANDAHKTGDGCLFSCHPSGSVSNPTLTLVPADNEQQHHHQQVNVNNNNAGGFHVNPAPGDDLSPPNAVDANKMNGIAIPVSASAGWSESPPKSAVYPSSISYDLRLRTKTSSATTTKSTMAASESLELTVAFEYSNPHFDNGESMMVKVAIAKTLVQKEISGAELALVATQFQEFIPAKNQWLDITADVDYTQTATAVVDAVMKDPTAGQTAGMATVTAKTIELTLGPFSAKARLNLTFQTEKLYTYDAMSVKADASDIGSHRLLPLWVTMPFAPINHEAGLSKFSVRLQAPMGSSIMPMNEYLEAYQNLKKQDSMKATTIVAVAELVQQHQVSGAGGVGYQFHWDSLPPRSCGVLAWLSLPNPMDDDSGFDFVHIGRCLEQFSGSVQEEHPSNSTQAHALIQLPSAEDLASLQVPLPGFGPIGSLWRVKVKMPNAQPRHKPYFILNLTLSDKSGSTGMHVRDGVSTSGTTMRQRFNELAEVRFLKRLESIPALVQSGVLRLDDVWMDVFLAFDSAAPNSSIQRVIFRVNDAIDSIAEVVKAIREHNYDFASSELPFILQHVQRLREVTPGGLTDFSVGPNTLVREFGQWKREAQSLAPEEIITCTFVEFDTDGGHNRSGGYIESLQNLCEVYDVRNGVVTGFGSWLNQDNASSVARILGSTPAQLALQVPAPGTEGLNKVFRRGFSAWVSALRQPPNLTVKVSAGSVIFPVPQSTRKANAVEALALRRIGERYERLPKFGLPDISNESFTKAVIEGTPAGDEMILYFVSRLNGASNLRDALEIETSVDGSLSVSKAHITIEEEASSGSFLAYDWLRMLTGQSNSKGFQLSPLIVTSLRSRLEEEVSFRFNIASPSGSTSYLGRCKTVADRAPIDPDHQPVAPEPPLKVEPHRQVVARKPLLLNYCRQGKNACKRSSAAPQMSPFASHEFLRSGLTSASPSTPIFQSNFQIENTSVPEVVRSGNHSAVEQGRRRCNTRRRSEGPHHSGAPQASLAPPRSTRRPSAPAKPCGDPSWMDAIAVPVGSSLPLAKQDYDDLKTAIREIVHARQRLLGDVNINFICDVCNRSFGPGEDRYHCYDCQDFDACAGCRFRHQLPLHRMALISCSTSAFVVGGTTEEEDEDPLVGSLLKPSPGAATAATTLPTAVATLLSQPPQVDQTVVWCRNRLRRFLAAVLHWWPLFRETCENRERLPKDVSSEMVQSIRQCLLGSSDGNADNLLNTATIVIDSLERSLQ